MKDERRVKSTASDVPYRYADVDDQLLKDYPELKEIIEKRSKELAIELEHRLYQKGQ